MSDSPLNSLHSIIHSRLRILLLAALILPILFAVSLTVPAAHAAGTLYVSPAKMVARPPNTMLTYQVKVASMGAFTGWDVSVVTNSSLLSPVSIDASVNLLQANFSASVIEVINCVNGVGTGCGISDRPGVAHSSAVSSGASSTDGSSGLLFNMTYVVVGSGSGLLEIPPGLDIIFNGPVTVSHADSPGVYGTSPFFAIAANPASLAFTVGSFGTSTIALSSFNNFAGKVKVSASISPVLTNGPSAVLTNSTSTAPSVIVNLAANQTRSVTLNVTTTVSTPGVTYTVNVAGSIGGITRSVMVIVIVAPDFTITATSPADFNTGATASERSSTGNSTITIIPLGGFGATITLTTLTTPPTGLTANCPTGLTVTGTTAVTCSPTSSTPGTYLVNVTASGGGFTHSATFVSHVGDFSISVGSPVNFNSGVSGATIPVTLSSKFNFAGTVTLTPTVIPITGLTVTCPAPVSLTANATVLASCTLSSTTPGTYGVTVNAAGSPGSASHSAPVTVHVGGFTLTAVSPVNFNTGATGASISVALTSTFNFVGSVTLTTVVSPSTGLTVTCPAPVSLTVNTTVPTSCTLASTTPGAYGVSINGAGSPGTPTQSAPVTVHVGDFQISAAFVSFNTGATGASISVTSLQNFVGSVTLTPTVTPATGLAVTCPAPVSLAANATVAACTLSSAIPGAYSVTLTESGSPGTASHQAIVTVHVGDFTLSASSVNFNTGATGTSISISLTSVQNFVGSVTLTQQISPTTGLTVTCPAPVSLTANATTRTSCTLTSTTPAVYSVTITGSGSPGTASHQAIVIVHVGDFTISAVTPVNFNIGATGASISITLTSVQNFVGSVILTPTVSPTTGLTVTCPAPVSLAANATGPTSCTLGSTTPGTYGVTLKGAGLLGSASHSATLTVHVGDFTIIATGADLNVGQNGVTVGLTLTSTFNFAGTVILTGSTTPSGLAVSCLTTTMTANATQTASCSLSSTTMGAYAVTVSGSGSPGTASHLADATVHVGDFTLSVVGHDLDVGQTGVSVSVTLVSKFNFAGTVTLTSSATPSGLTVTCPAAAVTLSANGTATASCALASSTAGTYRVTVSGNGTSGTASHSQSAIVNSAASTQPAPTQPFFTSTTVGVIAGVLAAVALIALSLVLRRRRRIRAT